MDVLQLYMERSKIVFCRSYLMKRNVRGDGPWRKLHNDELHSLYSSLNIVRVIQSRRMRWAGHVARMGEVRGVYRVLVGRLEGKRPLEDLGVGGRITLRWTLGR
jgi:hypothetical protein